MHPLVAAFTIYLAAALAFALLMLLAQCGECALNTIYFLLWLLPSWIAWGPAWVVVPFLCFLYVMFTQFWDEFAPRLRWFKAVPEPAPPTPAPRPPAPLSAEELARRQREAEKQEEARLIFALAQGQPTGAELARALELGLVSDMAVEKEQLDSETRNDNGSGSTTDRRRSNVRFTLRPNSNGPATGAG